MQYNSGEFEEIINIFKAESEEIIEDLNNGFLQLEKNPDNKEPLKKLFQVAHSLKGSAGMLGLTNIQDIAHKIEDILSFWEKNDSVIDKNSFQVLYDVCDYLNEIVNKSVEQSDNTDEITKNIINKLNKFITISANENEKQENTNSFEYIKKNATDINAILLELMFVVEKDDDLNNIDEILLVISDNLARLKEIFNNTDFSDIQKYTDEIINDINNSDKNNILNLCRTKITKLRNEVYKLYKEHNLIPDADKINPKSNIDKQQQTRKKQKREKNNNFNIEEIFNNLLKNLNLIKFDKNSLIQTEKTLNDINVLTENKEVKQIISKTIRILDIFIEKDSVADNDFYMVILQCVYFIKNCFLSDTTGYSQNNYNFLIDRLNLIQDMHNPEALKGVKITDENISLQNISTDPNIELLRNKINSYEFQEIKTMRIDTVKLDNLVAQTGELLVNGIKSREHLSDLSIINNKLKEWNSINKKMINYIKYAEKRGIMLYGNEESANIFNKRFQNFLDDNSRTITEFQKDFEKIYDVISDDDNKLHQTAAELESIVKSMRLLPLATIFHSFPRMVRDIAQENNKKINFIVSGSDTCVDKKIIEEIKTPLIHIIRNSISHGIESPKERIAKGKNEEGIIKLSVKQVENNIIIVIEDDGYGINFEKVKQSAIKKGIFTQEEIDEMSDEQLMKILFLPGFTTEDFVSQISGRGIGLDVVKTKINNLNGEIYIDSVLNKGCRVTIRIPLSMSTINTFIISANNQKYAIPVNNIKYVEKIKPTDILTNNNQNSIIHDGHSVPLYFLSEILGEKPKMIFKEDTLTVLIIENQDRKAAFITDELIGSQELLHKKLVPPILKIKNISGFSTLATGEICLIINPYELIKNTLMREFLPQFDLNKLLLTENKKLNNSKILIYGNKLDFIRNDISDTCDNIILFNNVSSLYDYIKGNNIDILISYYDKNNQDLINLYNHIKTDEILNNIKIIFITEYEDFEQLNYNSEIKPDLKININKYSPQKLKKSLEELQ